MADTYQEAAARLEARPQAARSWSFIKDGPPLLLVAVIFAGLLAL
jgi:hypothetical protein